MPDERTTTAATTPTPMSAASRQSVISFKNQSKPRLSGSRAGYRKEIPTRKIPYKIHMDGVEVTPLALMEIPSVANLALSVAASVVSDSTMQHMADFVDFKRRSEPDPQLSRQQSTVGLQPMGAVANLPSMTEVTRLDDMFLTRSSTFSLEMDDSRPTSAFRLPKEGVNYAELPDDAPVSIYLHETDFFELFDLPYEAAIPSDPDYDIVKEDVDYFESQMNLFKTKQDVNLQTTHVWLRAKNTQHNRKERLNQKTMVTYWQLYDELNRYNTPSQSQAITLHQRRKQIAQHTQETLGLTKAKQSLEAMSSAEVASTVGDMSVDHLSSVMEEPSAISSPPLPSTISVRRAPAIKFGENMRFAGLIIERLLQEQYDAEAQMAYCDLPPQDRFQPDIRYVYEFKTLWTFQTEQTSNRCVTCITWSANPLIFAVGYGRYFFSKTGGPGYVCIWNIKNSVLPERMMRLKAPVTCCAFSKRHPNLIAIGQINGTMTLIDVSIPSGNVLHESPETGEPIWSVAWLEMESEGEDEILIAGTQDGSILRFRFSDTFKVTRVMQVARSFGKIPGISRVTTAVPTLHSLQFAAVTTLCECPFEPDGYLVGTDDGHLHLCSAHYLRRHLSASSCHVGPVYSCHVSPFVDKIYLTSGADWSVRVWAHGIHDPLLTISSSMEPVEGAAWCTVDSALIASISGKVVSIWDLRRKISAPAGTVNSPDDEQFSAISWAPDGSLIVGDRGGKIYIMRLEGAPLRPFLQAQTLASCLRKALRATKPKLFAALKRLGEPF